LSNTTVEIIPQTHKTHKQTDTHY